MSSKLDTFYLPMELEACHSKVKLKRMITFDKGLSSCFQLFHTNIKPLTSMFKNKETFDLNCDEVVAMPYNEANNRLFVSSKKRDVMTVDTSDFSIQNTLKSPYILNYGSISKDTRTILFGANSGDQYIYYTLTNKLAPLDYVTASKTHHTMFTHSNSNAIFCGERKMCQVVDIEYNETVIELQDYHLDKNTIFNTCNINSGYILNSLVAAGDQGGKISIWNYIDGIKRYHFESNCKIPITMLKFHPTQNVFAAAYADGKIEIIDLRSDCCISSLSVGSNDRLTCMEFSPSGRLLFFGTLTGAVTVWDVCAECKNSSVQVFNASVRDIAVLADEASLVVVGASPLLVVYKKKKIYNWK